MKQLKIILTGASGFVGEGVLLECLAHPQIKEVLLLNRRPLSIKHPKLKECIVPDFMHLEKISAQLSGYDACFYCAGKTSVGMNEADYTFLTYDTTLHLANKLLELNPGMIFNFVSGAHTDGTEKGKVMWARVKGKTENALLKLPFKEVYNFRPGAMIPTAGQKNVKFFYKLIVKIFGVILPKQTSTMKVVGLAMINAALKGYPVRVLEVSDMKKLANDKNIPS